MSRRSDLRWALGEAWARQRTLLLGLGATVGVRGLLPAAIAVVTGRLVGGLEASAGTGTWDASLAWLAALVGVTLAEGVAQAAQAYLRSRLSTELLTELQVEITEQGAALDYAQIEDLSVQDLSARARARSIASLSSVATGVVDVGTVVVQAIGLGAVLLWIEPLSILAVGVVGLGYGLYQVRLAGRVFRVEEGRTTRRRQTHYYQGLVLDPGSAAEVKTLGLATQLVTRVRALASLIRDEDVTLHGERAQGDTAVQVAVALVTGGVFLRVIVRVANGTLVVGQAVAFLVALGRLQSTQQTLAVQLGRLREQLHYVGDLRRLIALVPAASVSATPSLVTLPAGPAPLTVEGVTFTYPGSDRPVLQDLSFRIEPGETVAVVGENAAGKSTLVKLLAGLYRPTSGRIAYGGVDLAAVPPAVWRRRLSLVLQHFTRYEVTAAENIGFGDAERWLAEPPEAVAPMAREAGADAFIRALPEGYTTPLGRRFGTVDPSGGQWQRIALARALARTDSDLVVLDEPAAHLDPRAEHQLVRRLRDLGSGRATLVISHRFAAVRDADRILVLDEGRLVEEGTHDALLARNGLYAALYRFQAEHLPED